MNRRHQHSVQEFLEAHHLPLEYQNKIEKLKEHFYNMDEILEEEIDPAIELIHSANPQFYKEYFTLRAMIPTGLQHTHESAMAV